MNTSKDKNFKYTLSFRCDERIILTLIIISLMTLLLCAFIIRSVSILPLNVQTT